MVQDLVMLTLLGCVLEVFSVKFSTVLFDGTPFVCVSLLITFIAVARWNLWGLIITPLLALTAMLGGMWSEVPRLALVYDWRMYLSAMIGLCAVGVNVIFFKKSTTKLVVSKPMYLSLILVLDYLLVCIVQLVVYRLLCSGTLMHSGEILYRHPSTGVVENVCRYGESTIIYNLLSLVVTFVGVFILRSQGIVCNVKQRFIDDKINADLDREDKKFTIKESDDETSGEVESEEKSEEELHSI